MSHSAESLGRAALNDRPIFTAALQQRHAHINRTVSIKRNFVHFCRLFVKCHKKTNTGQGMCWVRNEEGFIMSESFITGHDAM